MRKTCPNCKGTYITSGGECPVCDRRRPHVLCDTPVNQRAIGSMAVQLYNALAEMQRQFIGSNTVSQRAAQRETDRLLSDAREIAETRENLNASSMLFEILPEKSIELLRTRGPQTRIVSIPYETLRGGPKKR